MNFTVGEIIQLVGNGGGLALAAVMVIFVLREGKERERELRADLRAWADKFASFAKTLDDLADEIRDMREAVKK